MDNINKNVSNEINLIKKILEIIEWDFSSPIRSAGKDMLFISR